MASRIDPQLLHGRWVRAPEEDTEAEAVYRPAGHPLPRARGREGMELRPDGTAVQVSIGRADLAAHREGRWHMADDTVQLEFSDDAGGTQQLEVTDASSDRLVVKKRPR